MKEQNIEKQKQIFKALNKKLVSSILLMIIAFFFVQIYITSLVGTKSAEVEAVRIEKDQLRLENEILKSKIDENKSLSKVESSIKDDGLRQKLVVELEEVNGNEVALN